MCLSVSRIHFMFLVKLYPYQMCASNEQFALHAAGVSGAAACDVTIRCSDYCDVIHDVTIVEDGDNAKNRSSNTLW